jgi:hypothetical protein
MRVLTTMTVALSIASASAATLHSRPPLCTASEKAVFSCPVGNKTLSICASADLSPTSGYLKYRFGRSLQRVELSYPSEDGHPRRSFSFFQESGGHWSVEQLSFAIADYVYIVFVERSAIESNGSGVTIKSQGKKVAHLACDQPRPDPDNLYSLRDLGLPSVEYQDDGLQ